MTLPDLELGHEPAALEQIRNAFGVPGALLLLVGMAWYAARRGRALLAATIALLVGATLPWAAQAGYRSWTAAPLALAADRVFRPWRQSIPVGAEVLWMDDPVAVWVMLERPSYLSQSQSAGIVFSPRTAAEVRRRAEVLRPLVDPDWMIGLKVNGPARARPVTPEVLGRICSDPMLGFVVSSSSDGRDSPSVEWPDPGKRLWLISCDKYR
jgi:hypothetical protein